MQSNVQLQPPHQQLALGNIFAPRQKKRKALKAENDHIHEVILIDSDDDESEWVQIVNDTTSSSSPSPRSKLKSSSFAEGRIRNSVGATLSSQCLSENRSPSSGSDGPKLECPICFDTVPHMNGSFLSCEHFFCNNCLKSYIESEIASLASSGKHTIMCMIPNCCKVISEREIANAVGQRKLNRFQRLSLEQVASINVEMSFCPFPDCGMIFSLNENQRKTLATEFAQSQANAIDLDGSKKIVETSSPSVDNQAYSINLVRNKARMACPRCSNVFCIVCIEDWSNCACSQKAKDAACTLRKGESREQGLLALLSPFSKSRSAQRQKNEGFAENNNFRECKRCGIKIEKESGCDKMKCRCGYRFCFHCGAENAQCNCTPMDHGFWDNDTNFGDFSNLKLKKSPT